MKRILIGNVNLLLTFIDREVTFWTHYGASLLSIRKQTANVPESDILHHLALCKFIPFVAWLVITFARYQLSFRIGSVFETVFYQPSCRDPGCSVRCSPPTRPLTSSYWSSSTLAVLRGVIAGLIRHRGRFLGANVLSSINSGWQQRPWRSRSGAPEGGLTDGSGRPPTGRSPISPLSSDVICGWSRCCQVVRTRDLGEPSCGGIFYRVKLYAI